MELNTYHHPIAAYIAAGAITMEQMYNVKYHGSDSEIIRVVSAATIAEFCLQRCGGGWNEKQVADAMELQREVIATGYLSRSYRIEPVETVEVTA
jgi:hypothetical protein